MEKLPSIFPTQTTTVDILHTISLGLFRQWLELLKSQYPNLYDQMVVLSQYMKLPRTDTYYNHDLNYLTSWKARDYLFFSISTGLALIGLLEFPDDVKQCFFRFSEIIAELNDKRTTFLSPLRVLALEKEFVEYEKQFAALFGHSSFKPNNHRASHLFRDVLIFGRPFNFSMFSFESANILAPEGVSGTKGPLDSIIRHHNNMLLYHKALSALLHNQVFLANFPDTFDYFFPELIMQGDSNPNNLIKIYQPTLPGAPPLVKFYLERSRFSKETKLNNSFIEFLFEGSKVVGKIVNISKEQGFVVVSELTKKRLVTDFRGKFFRAVDDRRLFQMSFDRIIQVFGSIFLKEKQFLFTINH